MTTDATDKPDWMKHSEKGSFDKASDRGLFELKEREQAREERIKKLSEEVQKRIAMGREQREKEVAAKRAYHEKNRKRNKDAIHDEFLDPQKKGRTEEKPTEKHHVPRPSWVSEKGPTVRTPTNEEMENLVDAELAARISADIDDIRRGWEATELELIDWEERSAEITQEDRLLRNAREITEDRGGWER